MSLASLSRYILLLFLIAIVCAIIVRLTFSNASPMFAWIIYISFFLASFLVLQLLRSKRKSS